MKKLIQILIVCGLFVVMGGTASGETLSKEEMDAEYEKSQEAKKNKDWVLAKEIVTPLAEKGHAKSQGRLGAIYLRGPGKVPKDLKKAFK
jgi:TPR repeat protein